MTAVLTTRPRAMRAAVVDTRVAAVLLVLRGPETVGAILIGPTGRVRRATPDLPADVVLKAYMAHTRRREVAGEVTSWDDGAAYTWRVVGA